MTADELRLLVETRRDLHRHPELAYEERRTAGIVAERLNAAGYSVRTGVAATGVVGEIEGGGDGPTVLLRADMDALPIHEETGHDFESTVPGRMHACGHDGHVAILLTVAERMAERREQLGGTVRVVFQPAEEGRGGASRMIAEGVHDGADVALGLHLWAGITSGTIGVVDGPLMAGSLMFRATILGRGGHGAIPEQTVDPIVVAAHTVTALQTVVSRSISPLDSATVSIGRIQGGSAFNVIADTATMEGTIRAFHPATLEAMLDRVTTIGSHVAEAFGARFELEVTHRDSPTVNTPWVAEMVREGALSVVGEERVVFDPAVRTMASEDFGRFLDLVPGCYFFVGAGHRERGAVHPHHSPRFDICEDALPVAVDVLEAAALRVLASRPDERGAARVGA